MKMRIEIAALRMGGGQPAKGLCMCVCVCGGDFFLSFICVNSLVMTFPKNSLPPSLVGTHYCIT